ncbi:MAG: LOG family protein [Myxococcota bacterium]|nr:LOG family protein [Myxococcota bacterium]
MKSDSPNAPDALSRKHHRREIESLDALQAALDQGQALRGWVVQGLSLCELHGIESANWDGCLFWGCDFGSPGLQAMIVERGGIIIPRFEGLPFETDRTILYTPDALYEGFDEAGYEGSLDYRIYLQSHTERLHPGGRSLYQSLAERLHDHSIFDALEEYVFENASNGVVALMGGHAVGRDEALYRQVAQLAQQLAASGFLLLTGGGPGVMEAANLGARLADCSTQDLDEAITLLARAPHFEPDPQAFVAQARQVIERFSAHKPRPNLAIPTWFYGHEPSNLFATAVAKFFDNAVREESIVALPTEGIVFAPGSAGTMQEIFQDLAQNHYNTYGKRSPMVFFGESHRRVYELIRAFVAEKGVEHKYGQLLALFTEVQETVDFLVDARKASEISRASEISTTR